MVNLVGNDWDNELSVIWNSPGFHKFMDIVNSEYDNIKLVFYDISFYFCCLCKQRSLMKYNYYIG